MEEPDIFEAITRSGGSRSFGERLVLLALAYGLTTVVGGYLAYHYQERARVHEHDAAQFESQKAEATSLFREVSDLMGERSYLMLRLQFGAGSDPRPDDFEARWDAYREVLHTWNAGRFTRRAMLDAYFGRDLWQLEKDVHYKFRDVGKLLEAGYRQEAYTAEQLAGIEAGMNEVTEMIKRFNAYALRSLLSGEVGRFRTADMATFDEIDDQSTEAQ